MDAQDGDETVHVEQNDTTLSGICIEQNEKDKDGSSGTDKVSEPANNTISDLELPINPPNFEVSLAVILPCYRESEDELGVSLNNYLWKHSSRTTGCMKRNELVPYSQKNEPSDEGKTSSTNKEYVDKFNKMINGMFLLIVVDGNMNFEQESDTLKAIKNILGIEQALSEWKEATNCKFYETENIFGERCKIVVIVKGIPGFAGKRYSQSLCCRVLMNLADKYPHLMQLKYLLLVDADTGFRISDLYKSIKIMKDTPKMGGIQIGRRLLNFSWFNFVSILQNLEYHAILLKRKIISGFGYVCECDGSFILLRYETMKDIIDDYSVCISSSDACKYNAANMGEDSLMARMVEYYGWSMEQIIDADINHYVNGVETFYELFDQRRRWYNNGFSHVIANFVYRFEKGKINFTYRPCWNIIPYILYLIACNHQLSMFSGPALYIFLWSITCKIIYPPLDIFYPFITFVGFMMLHGVMSFQQRPIMRKYWINFVCFVCIFLTVVSWLCMLYSLINFLVFDELNEYAFGYLLFVFILVVAVVSSMIVYCIIFGINEWHQILPSMLIFWFICGGHAIYDFGINIWTISNYFDTRWGTRENVKDGKNKNLGQSKDLSFIFPNLSGNPRQSLFGISICCSEQCQFLMPLLQYFSSGSLAFLFIYIVELIEQGYYTIPIWVIYTIPIPHNLLVFFLLVSAKLRDVSY